MKTSILALTTLLISGVAHAAPDAAQKKRADAARADMQKTFGIIPTAFRSISDRALPGAWEEMKGLQMNPKTALSGKVKEMIGLAVASQIPCTYCTFAHTEFGRFNGASEEEIGEAIAMGALTRHWSTFLNGMQFDMNAFKKDLANLLEAGKKVDPKQPQIEVVDAKTARADIQRALGYTPAFIAQFPESGLAGAWIEFRDVQISDKTALSGKEKELIGLAVASQVPCAYCVVAHTQFAKAHGATDQEIGEAVGMAALTRNLSTMFNGHQADPAQWKKDIQRILAGLKKRQS